MWLLHTTSRKLRNFLNDIPDYVILSHTWGDDEVAFEEIDQPYAFQKAGYEKIIGCCRLAINDGFDWAWIDTCCIDKKSSAELSEAINSMYRWYWEAAICYVYLSDVDSGCMNGSNRIFEVGERVERRHGLEGSRWFTRGWTLQELIAPEVVEFYDAQWTPLGTKAKLVDRVASITNIASDYILDRNTVKEAIISTKFSWMASRYTTREEDMAYCLLGIVQVNMPMLYGEGKRAFLRLQLEIIRQSNDHSIFAWETERTTNSVLAPSPSCFRNSMFVKRTTLPGQLQSESYAITNKGLRIELPVLPTEWNSSLQRNCSVAILDCKGKEGHLIGIQLEVAGDGKHHRVPGSKLAMIPTDFYNERLAVSTLYLMVQNHQERERAKKQHEIVIGDMIIDDKYRVEAITVETGYYGEEPSFTHLAGLHVPGTTNALSIQEDLGKILRDLLIIEGRSMRFRIRMYESDSIIITISLSSGRTTIKATINSGSFETSQSGKLWKIDNGTFVLSYDHVILKWRSGRTIEVNAKKQRRNGSLQQSLTFKLNYKQVWISSLLQRRTLRRSQHLD
jgi:hypothetical protein